MGSGVLVGIDVDVGRAVDVGKAVDVGAGGFVDTAGMLVSVSAAVACATSAGGFFSLPGSSATTIKHSAMNPTAPPITIQTHLFLLLRSFVILGDFSFLAMYL